MGNWEDLISINSQDECRFETLPPIRMLESRETFAIDIDKLRLRRSLQEYMDLDVSRLPLTADREGYYGDNHFEYWLSGLETHLLTVEILEGLGVSRGSYGELGSASGRVLRHAAAYGDFDGGLWAFDINWRHIRWIVDYLPKEIVAVHTSSLPHLPVPDATFDCVSVMSVFTHIETFETAWLAELWRVLKPDGVALISVVTERQVAAMDATWPMFAAITQHPGYSPDLVERVARSGKLTLRWDGNRSYSSNVVYATSYIEGMFQKLFAICARSSDFSPYQDVYVLRRKTLERSRADWT